MSADPPAPRAAPRWIGIFLVFALAYFLAALLRAVTATLAPSFSAEFALGAADLGLLAGAYFLGFALLQLPLGVALDDLGPRRVEIALLLLALAGCAVFAAADGFGQLVLGRMLIGMGVAACLMSPLTFFRLHWPAGLQLRANSWMLMTGSLGMVASTVPVQMLLPLWGWRGLFWALCALLALAAAALWRWLPADGPRRGLSIDRPRRGLSIDRRRRGRPSGPQPAPYAQIVRHPQFVGLAPLGMFLHGGLVAMQALWIGPWLTEVCGLSPQQASRGLLLVNMGMLCAFLAWGFAMPVLMRRGLSVHRLLVCGLPVSLFLLLFIALRGEAAGAGLWMLWCVATSLVTLAQPALAQAFPAQMAGRVLSAYNLAIFVGIFLLQWGMGAAIDVLQSAGVDATRAYRITVAGLAGLSLLSYLWFAGLVAGRAHNRAHADPT